MTYQEKRDEFRRDFEKNVAPAYIHCFGNEKKFERIARKLPNDKHYHFPVIEYDSKGGNHYMLFYSVRGKKGFKKTGLQCNAVIVYTTADGKLAAMTALDDTPATFWSQHFFQRFRERGLKDEALSLHDTMVAFFKELTYAQGKEVDSEKYENNIYTMIDRGLMLGTFEYGEERVLSYRTFISNEMIKEGQYDDYAELVERALAEERNLDRPDYILRYEAKHKDDVLFYGKPIVIDGLNEGHYSFYDAKRFESHDEALKTYMRSLLTGDVTIDDEENKQRLWYKYVSNQRKKGNMAPMCSAPLMYHSADGFKFWTVILTTYHNDRSRYCRFAPYRVGNDVFVMMKVENSGPRMVNFIFNVSVLEKFKDMRKELKGWSVEDAYTPFIQHLSIDEFFMVDDHSIAINTNYGQFVGHLLSDKLCLCFDELLDKKIYMKNVHDQSMNFSWIDKSMKIAA